MSELLSRLDAARARFGASRVGDALSRVGALFRPLRRMTEALRGPFVRVRRSYRDVALGRHTGVRYHDGLVTLDRDAVTVHGYYYPFGRKRIPYSDIRGVHPWPLTGGRAYRVHGVGLPRVWYARDAKRGERTVGLLLDLGNWLRPVISPQDPARVQQLLRERIG